MSAPIQIVFLILFPVLILYLEQKNKLVKIISPIVICYIVGIVIANLPFITLDRDLLTKVYEISISLAIPLLLFNSDVVAWINHAGKSILSYGLSVIAVIISATVFYYVYRNAVPDAWKVSGMLVGVYTGGTPNMSAIGLAFETPKEVYILLNSSDVVLGSIYFICIITFIRPLLGLFLPHFTSGDDKISGEIPEVRSKLSRKQFIINIIIALLLGIVILGLAVWISKIIMGIVTELLVIMVLTTLGIGASFVKKIRQMKGSYDMAFYLLLIFSLSVGTLADVNELLNKSSNLFVYTAFVMFGAILIHYILTYFFRIDRDTAIITSTAAIYGPAFIGPVANAIKNKSVIVPGITMGLLGYAIGNYIGIGIGMLLK